MKRYQANEIRNVVLLGHSGSGKTSLAEAMLFYTGTTDRLGKTAEGNTVCDYDAEEIKRRISVSCALAPFEWQNAKINMIDTPGLFDFEGESMEGLRAADCALITVSGKSGVNVGTEKAWSKVTRCRMPRAFFINKLDEAQADFHKVFEQLKNTFGPTVCPVVVPVEGGYANLTDLQVYAYDAKGKSTRKDLSGAGQGFEELKTALYETIAETDENLLEKYLAGENFTREELVEVLHKGIRECSIAPVFCGSAAALVGIDQLLSAMISMFPAADENDRETAESGLPETKTTIRADASGPFAAVVFKTLADPFVGKLSFFKVVSGKIASDVPVINARNGQAEKVGKLYMLRGKKQMEVDAVGAGDIGAVSKMTSPLTGDTLCSPQHVLKLEGIQFPAPCLSMAVTPKTKGDEDKISQGLQRLTEEDPTFRFAINGETKQQIISGLGEQHLDVIVSKLKSKFGVSVNLALPRVAYRETIRKKVRVEGKHKKQTGGHGQYGHVWIEFEPCDSEEMVFEEKVFGGAVPRNFFPAVEKGLRECVPHGVLAGYPVVHLKATLVDGSYHPVDSSEMAFKVAAGLAYKAGLPQAGPVLLEPVGLLKVSVPETNMGDVIGEINKRRGRVLGMGSSDGGLQVVEAETPIAEMHDFSTVLRSVTQGRGSFTLNFQRYEEAPPQVTQKVMEDAKQTSQAAG